MSVMLKTVGIIYTPDHFYVKARQMGMCLQDLCYMPTEGFKNVWAFWIQLSLYKTYIIQVIYKTYPFWTAS